MARCDVHIAGKWYSLGELTLNEGEELEAVTGYRWTYLGESGMKNNVTVAKACLVAMAVHLGAKKEDVEAQLDRMNLAVLDKLIRLVPDEGLLDILPAEWQDGLPLGAPQTVAASPTI